MCVLSRRELASKCELAADSQEKWGLRREREKYRTDGIELLSDQSFLDFGFIDLIPNGPEVSAYISLIGCVNPALSCEIQATSKIELCTLEYMLFQICCTESRDD